MAEPAIAVAIPVRDEAGRIASCLDALAAQAGAPPFSVVLLVNNTTDATAAIVAGWRACHALPVEVVERVLPPDQAHAGTARSLAMVRAAELVGRDGLLFTTDADGRAPPDWVATNLAAFRSGVDAVAGRAVIDPVEALLIPAHLHEADARECAYAALIDEIASLIDADAFDPWPRHEEASGASIAVRAAAYHAIGGMTAIKLGEDRQFVRDLVAHDRSVRHDPAVWVTVSGRTEGRAKGGMADTIRRRMSAPDLLVDDRLEALDPAVLRARMRRSARLAHRALIPVRWLAAALGVEIVLVEQALSGPFGRGWAAIEATSPVLRRRRMPVADLPGETRRASTLRDQLLGERRIRERRTDPADTARAALA